MTETPNVPPAKNRKSIATNFKVYDKTTKQQFSCSEIEALYVDEIMKPDGKTFQTVSVKCNINGETFYATAYLNDAVSKEEFAEAMKLVKAKKK